MMARITSFAVPIAKRHLKPIQSNLSKNDKKTTVNDLESQIENSKELTLLNL